MRRNGGTQQVPRQLKEARGKFCCVTLWRGTAWSHLLHQIHVGCYCWPPAAAAAACLLTSKSSRTGHIFTYAGKPALFSWQQSLNISTLLYFVEIEPLNAHKSLEDNITPMYSPKTSIHLYPVEKIAPVYSSRSSLKNFKIQISHF